MLRPAGFPSRHGQWASFARFIPRRSWSLAALGAFLAGPAHADPYSPLGYRTIDGTGNNAEHPAWGSAGTVLLRCTPAAHADSVSVPPGPFPGARAISNAVAAQTGSIPNDAAASDYLWQWGQFLDHDLDFTNEHSPPEPFPIQVPAGDPFFDPDSTGGMTIPLNRSRHTDPPGVRQQLNLITAYIDASNVYGSDTTRANALRALDGTGRLKTSAGDLLPFNTLGLPNAPTGADPTLFLAGDVRSNEQVALTALHTLFVREHNFWADSVAAADTTLTDDEIYLAARSLVGAEMQVITYREFLPKLLGPGALSAYAGYDPAVNAGILNEFSGAAFRLGHTLLSPQLHRLDASLAPIAGGDLPLRDGFFNPGEITGNGIDPILRGLAHQAAQEMDPYVVDDVRNFLFGPPGAGGFDLASLNIQRGRDHGLPRYNEVRVALGLSARASFTEVSSDPVVQGRLLAAYASVNDIDLWVGALAEDHVNGGMVGELLFTVLRKQFEALRDGDRFWYEIVYPAPVVALLETQTLAGIIRRNTGISSEIPDDVFTHAGSLVAVHEPGPIRLGFPAPNPTRSTSTILLTVDPGPSRVMEVEVFDILGRRVSTVLHKTMGPGTYPLRWDGTGTGGNRVPEGVYFLCAASGSHLATRKVVIAR